MLEQKTIANIINENYVFARVLDFFGVNFYEYSSSTLKKVCVDKGISVDKLISHAEGFEKEPKPSKSVLNKYPIDLIIEYLRHSHHIFVKDQLPYIAKLIERYRVSSVQGERFMKDLQFIFPLFLKEFIEHIYEEEDNFFVYLSTLSDAVSGKGNYSKLYYDMKYKSVLNFALSHGEDDDEMVGIRTITQNYTLTAENDVHLTVILKELEKFDLDLKLHAAIEDDILMPKAVQLERKVLKLMTRKAHLN